jgi:hypothetical protein
MIERTMPAWLLESGVFEFDGFFRMMWFTSRRHIGACSGDEQNELNGATLSYFRIDRQQ